MHERFVALLASEGISLHAVRYCPHAPWESCQCRKPSPGLLLTAADEFGLDLGQSFIVGDKGSDIEAGHRAGCHTILLAPNGVACDRADHIARDWNGAVAFILGKGTAV